MIHPLLLDTGRSPGSGIAVVDILFIAVIGIAILTASRLPGLPQ